MSDLLRADYYSRVVVRIGEPYMKVAVIALMERAGVSVVDVDDGTAPLVTDDPRQQSARTILIVENTVGAAQAAIAALMNRRLGGLVSRDEPEDLFLALTCLSRSTITAPRQLLDLAETAPTLASRQLRILALLAEGMANSRIAERLTLSEPTVKREISDLLRTFECSSRIELAMKASEVGYATI